MTIHNAEIVDKMRNENNGQLPAYVWPGGYPVYYLASDNDVLCAKCANDYQEGRDTEEQLKPIAADINWEDDSLQCGHCEGKIESAYRLDEQLDTAVRDLINQYPASEVFAALARAADDKAGRCLSGSYSDLWHGAEKEFAKLQALALAIKG